MSVAAGDGLTAAGGMITINVDASSRELPSLDDPLITTLIVDPAMAAHASELGGMGPMTVGPILAPPRIIQPQAMLAVGPGAAAAGGLRDAAVEPARTSSGCEGAVAVAATGSQGGMGGEAGGSGDDKAQLLDLIRQGGAASCLYGCLPVYAGFPFEQCQGITCLSFAVIALASATAPSPTDVLAMGVRGSLEHCIEILAERHVAAGRIIKQQ